MCECVCLNDIWKKVVFDQNIMQRIAKHIIQLPVGAQRALKVVRIQLVRSLIIITNVRASAPRHTERSSLTRISCSALPSTLFSCLYAHKVSSFARHWSVGPPRVTATEKKTPLNRVKQLSVRLCVYVCVRLFVCACALICVCACAYLCVACAYACVCICTRMLVRACMRVYLQLEV